MSRLPRTCEDCGAPIGSDMRPLGECWFWGQTEARFEREGRKDFETCRRSGWDPPCECNHYNWFMRRRAWEKLLEFWIAPIIAVPLAALFIAIILHFAK
jgi:hypothetical protein